MLYLAQRLVQYSPFQLNRNKSPEMSSASTDFGQRLKNLLLFPSYEWKVISLEKASLAEDFKRFGLRLIFPGAISMFIGSFLFIRNEVDIDAYRFSYPLVQALFYLVFQTVFLILSAFFVNKLANRFSSVSDARQSGRLVLFSVAPLLLVFIIFNLHKMFFLSLIPGLYSYFLLYKGLPLLLKTPDNKRIAFVFLIFIVQAGIYWALALAFSLLSGYMFSIAK